MKRAIITLLVMFTAVGAVGCSGSSSAGTPGGAKATAAKSGPALLYGKWSGKLNMGSIVDGFGGFAVPEYAESMKKMFAQDLVTTFDFRSNGRVYWTQKGPFNLNITGSGTYKVKREEDDRLILEMVNDLNPDRTWGWVLIFQGDNEFTITGFDDMPLTVQRVK